MKDVFLSYSSKDREKAVLVERALEAAGFSVFWDQEVPPGRDWDSWIREHLTGAKVAIVLWSKASVASANVKHEAMIAQENGKLIPAMVEPLTPADFPMGMYLTQAADLTHFRGGADPGMAKLLAEVSDRIGRAAQTSPPVRKGVAPGVIAWIAAPIALVGLALVAVQNGAALCGATGLLCADGSAPSAIAPPPTDAAATLDPVAAIQGDWAWTGIACGQGPHVALEVIDGEKTLLFTTKDTRFRHAIAGTEGTVLKTIVVEPEDFRGTTYRMELAANGRGLSLYEGAQASPDTWEKCP